MARIPTGFTSTATFEDMAHALGYARVSTTDQNAQLQHDALTTAGCYRIFTDTASGALQSRPPLLSGDKLATARKLYDQQDMTVAQIGEVLGVSRTTIYHALRRDRNST